MNGPRVCDEKGLEPGPSVRGEIPLIAKCAMSGSPTLNCPTQAKTRLEWATRGYLISLRRAKFSRELVTHVLDGSPLPAILAFTSVTGFWLEGARNSEEAELLLSRRALLTPLGIVFPVCNESCFAPPLLSLRSLWEI